MQDKTYLEKLEDAAFDAANYFSVSAKSAMDAITGKSNEEKVRDGASEMANGIK